MKRRERERREGGDCRSQINAQRMCMKMWQLLKVKSGTGKGGEGVLTGEWEIGGNRKNESSVLNPKMSRISPDIDVARMHRYVCLPASQLVCVYVCVYVFVI